MSAIDLVEDFPDLPGLQGRPVGLLRALEPDGDVALAWDHFARALMTQGSLCPRLREIAILRTAWRRRCPYIWGGHVAIGLAAGLTDDDVARLALPSTGWDEVAAEVVEATDQLVDNGCVHPATWTVLRRHLGAPELVELPLLVGQYTLVSLVVATFRIPPEPGSAPFPRPRERAGR